LGCPGIHFFVDDSDRTSERPSLARLVHWWIGFACRRLPAGRSSVVFQHVSERLWLLRLSDWLVDRPANVGDFPGEVCCAEPRIGWPANFLSEFTKVFGACGIRISRSSERGSFASR
jgi:hypothetical protein